MLNEHKTNDQGKSKNYVRMEKKNVYQPFYWQIPTTFILPFWQIDFRTSNMLYSHSVDNNKNHFPRLHINLLSMINEARKGNGISIRSFFFHSLALNILTFGPVIERKMGTCWMKRCFVLRKRKQNRMNEETSQTTHALNRATSESFFLKLVSSADWVSPAVNVYLSDIPSRLSNL